jgi:hypothetical protein
MRDYIYHSSQFTWHPGSRLLISEASELGLAPGFWPDRIQIVSARTGDVRVFVRAREVDGAMAYRPFVSGLPCSVHILNT